MNYLKNINGFELLWELDHGSPENTLLTIIGRRLIYENATVSISELIQHYLEQLKLLLAQFNDGVVYTAEIPEKIAQFTRLLDGVKVQAEAYRDALGLTNKTSVTQNKLQQYRDLTDGLLKDIEDIQALAEGLSKKAAQRKDGEVINFREGAEKLFAAASESINTYHKRVSDLAKTVVPRTLGYIQAYKEVNNIQKGTKNWHILNCLEKLIEGTLTASDCGIAGENM